MRLAVACVAVLALAVPAAAQTDRSVLAPAHVTALAAEGEMPQRIAFLSAGADRGCGAIRLWRPGTSPAAIGPVACVRGTSTGSGAYGLSFGSSVAWATYAGGNIREHTVWLSSPRLDQRPRRYRRARAGARVSHDVDARSPLVMGEGDGPFVSYAIGETAYLHSGSRRYSWRLPARALGLAVGGPYLAVRRADGPVSVYADWQTSEIDRLDYERGVAVAVKAHGGMLAVLRRGAVDVRAVYGRVPETFRLPRARSYGDDHCGVVRCALAELRLADLQGPLVVYIHRRAIHVLRVTDDRDVVVRRPATGPVHAELEATGLSYSSGRRVSFVPRAEIDRLLR